MNNMLEHKLVTFATPAGGNWTLAGVVSNVTTACVQGNDIFQRNGDQITIKSMDFRFDTTSTGAGNATTFRIIVFADMTANGAAPAVTDVLDQADLRSAYKHIAIQRKRFRIFHDKFYTNVFGTPTQSRDILLRFPNLNHTVYYNGTTATSTDNGKGAVFVLVISTSTGNGGWSFLPDIRYTDA